MKHSAGEKFSIQGADLNVEIQGCFPGGQGRRLQISENSYQITINGIPMDITERHLDLLQQSVIAKGDAGVIEIPNGTLEEVVQPKKRMGRPPKIK